MIPDSRWVKCGIALVALCAAGAAQDARSIVRRSINADNRNDALRRNYTYKVFDETRDLDSSGKVKAIHSTLDEVMYIGGSTYFHTIERDGKPLPLKDAAKERAKLDKAVAQASRLTDAEKAARRDKELRERVKGRERLQYIPDAFDFKLAGETVLNGRVAWEILAAPRRDYTGPHASLLRNMEGTLWIDKQDYQWVKVEADALDTISIGWFLARVAKGTRISFENVKVNGEIWAPKHIALQASARLALLKKFNGRQELTFSDYRKFQSDSRIVSSEDIEK